MPIHRIRSTLEDIKTGAEVLAVEQARRAVEAIKYAAYVMMPDLAPAEEPIPPVSNSQRLLPPVEFAGTTLALPVTVKATRDPSEYLRVVK